MTKKNSKEASIIILTHLNGLKKLVFVKNFLKSKKSDYRFLFDKSQYLELAFFRDIPSHEKKSRSRGSKNPGISRRSKIPKKSRGFCDNPGIKIPNFSGLFRAFPIPIPGISEFSGFCTWDFLEFFRGFQIPIPIPGISGFFETLKSRFTGFRDWGSRKNPILKPTLPIFISILISHFSEPSLLHVRSSFIHLSLCPMKSTREGNLISIRFKRSPKPNNGAFPLIFCCPCFELRFVFCVKFLHL